MAVTFDAIGGGLATTSSGTASPYNVTWSHTATGSDRAVILSVGGARVAAGGLPAGAATYGGVSMTQLGAMMTNNAGSGSYWMFFFGLLAPATGAQTVSVTITASGANLGLEGNSMSYAGVGSIGSVSSAFGATGTTMTHTVTGSATNNMIVQSFVAENSTAALIGSYNRTSRFSYAARSWSPAVLGGDAAGAASVAFTGTKSLSSTKWSSYAVDLVAGTQGGGVNTGAFFAMF
jgi:hypothetical protein